MATDPRAALDAAGETADDEIDLAATALQLARLATPNADWHAARDHLSEVARASASADVAPDDLIAQARLLAELLGDRFDYRGDDETYDDFANANLIRVTERRRGLPVALGIVWLHAAHAAGWDAAGVNMPGHFVIVLRAPREGSLVLDPFRGGVPIDVTGMRREVLAPMRRREVLLRLQNNVRLRLFNGGDLAGAALAARDMLRIAPDAVPLWMETGLLNMQLDEADAALECFGRVVALAPDSTAAGEARQAVERLRAGGSEINER